MEFKRLSEVKMLLCKLLSRRGTKWSRKHSKRRKRQY